MLQRIHSIFDVSPQHPQRWALLGFSVALVGSLIAAIALYEIWPVGIPIGLLILWLLVTDVKMAFWLAMACIPLSIEVELIPASLSTDFPSEPMMWLLTLAGIGWWITQQHQLNMRFLMHPVTLVLLAHLAWMGVAVLTSEDVFVSFKWYLAKGWYVIVFYFLAARMLQTERDFKQLLWWFFLPLLFTVLFVIIRHGMKGFEYLAVNYVMGPFFRNHVMYACLLAIFIPFLWYGTYWYPRWGFRWWMLVLGIGVLLVGIYFAFTRAAYVALVVAIMLYWIMRWRLVRHGLALFALLVALFVNWVVRDDNWLEFAPDYRHTVTHKRFDKLISATAEGKDISTMERVYRWVAGANMIVERPLVGFGPANFIFWYKEYTVTRFKTYVSRNPERSGIHNYYLMTATEQGLPGMALFIALCTLTMVLAERVYHQTKLLWRRRMLIAAFLCYSLINLMMFVNDFVETDKIGTLFFVCMAVIVNFDLKNREEAAQIPA